MRSTVSMTLASRCLVMMSRIAGWALNMAAARELRLLCSTVATSDRRTTLPLRHLDDDVAVVVERAQLGIALHARRPGARRR